MQKRRKEKKAEKEGNRGMRKEARKGGQERRGENKTRKWGRRNKNQQTSTQYTPSFMKQERIKEKKEKTTRKKRQERIDEK